MLQSNKNTIDSKIEWLNSIGSATFVIDANNIVKFWSRSCEILTGVKAETVLNTNQHWKGFYSEQRTCLADMVLDEDWQEKIHLYDNISKAPNTNRGLIASNWCQTPIGLKFLILEANALYDNENNVIGVIETLSDATKLKNAEDELQIFSKAVEYCSSSIFICDPRGLIEYVNPVFTELTGYSFAEVIGNRIDVVRPTDDLNQAKLLHSIGKEGQWKGEIQSVKKDGTPYWERCSLAAIEDSNGNIIHIVGIQDDITNEYEAAKKLNYDAIHDSLTGLMNRRGFEEKAGQLINNKKQTKTNHSLCFIDLDKFKIVNDSCGHEAGDELLKDVSQIFKNNVRKNDTLARLGGDEFVILMENCDLEYSHRVAMTLLNEIQDYDFFWQKEHFKIGLSVGIVLFDEVSNLKELMRRADSACYMAKDMGRNRIQVYADDDTELTKRHSEIRWITKIQKALDENAFYLDAQSIVSLKNQKTTHYELLVRMKDTDGNIISPNQFLPSAERYNLITNIDQWVIKQAFALLEEHPDFLDKINFISINISGQSLANNELIEFIDKEFKQTGISGNKICFEITETSAIKNLKVAKALINNFKSYGCLFAIDDFGSGLSSYAYLKNLPVDYLKIDGMFVKDIVNDQIDHALVKSMNEVGQILNIKTIAEFVENDEIKGMLKAIGVDYAQGYGISKPCNFESILKQYDNVYDIKSGSQIG